MLTGNYNRNGNTESTEEDDNLIGLKKVTKSPEALNNGDY